MRRRTFEMNIDSEDLVTRGKSKEKKDESSSKGDLDIEEDPSVKVGKDNLICWRCH
jgi:hypothetical protein